MKKLITLIFSLFGLVVSAQRPIEISDSRYSMVLPRNMSMENVELQCLEQAKLRAIEKECGIRISEVTINNVSEQADGVNQTFQTLTKTQVNGEWIRDTKEPTFKWTCEGNTLEVEATVSGLVQKFPDEGRVKLNLLTATDKAFKNTTTQFRDGSNLYLQLKASQKGFISVYYVDHVANTAYRLFPNASNNSLDMVGIQGDKSYTLFAGATGIDEHAQSPALNTYLSSNKKPQIDELVVIYSDSNLKKPMLNYDNTSKMYTLSIEEFYTWKAGLYGKNNQVSIGTIPITIQ
jgi:hypothetical protein